MTEPTSKNKLFISGTESITIFRSKILESLTTTHHLVPFLIFIPVVLFFIYEKVVFCINDQIDNYWYLIIVIISGILFWTFIEYTGHRFVFHSHPKSDFGKKMLYLIHGAHHDYPNDPKRLVVPPIVSVTVGILLELLSYYLFGAFYSAPFFAILVFSYLVYDWFHYASHHMTIKNKYIRMLIKHHLLHHYRDPDNGFGFTTTLWDRLMNSMFKK